jgi:hypothetical protein
MAAHAGSLTLDHGNGRCCAVIAGQGIIIKKAGIHSCLKDHIIGELLEEDGANGHDAFS